MAEVETREDREITKRDLWQLYFRSFFLQSSFSFERMQGVGLTWMFIPLIKKLYPKKEDQIEALQRHLVFYNTNPLTGSIITGMVAATEEMHAKGELDDPSSINSLKGSLIGPMAGIGDSIFILIFVTLLGVASGFSMEGNPIGAIILIVVFSLIWYFGLYFGVTQGYYQGESLLERLTGRQSEVFMGGLGIVGATVVGALVASWIDIVTPIGEGIFQDALNGILPKLLPLGFALLAYRLLRRGWSAVWVMILLLAIGMIGGHFGILGTSAALP